MLPPATQEQQAIISAIDNNGTIVTINAVAGSGKTTTNLLIAEKYKDRKILLLTYNNHLRRETMARAEKCNLHNIDIHTFHSFCGRMHGGICYNDTHMGNMVDAKLEEQEDENENENTDEDADFDDEYADFVDVSVAENTSGGYYDVIIFDECQDLTSLLFRFCIKVVKCYAGKNTNIVVLGDYKQNIYRYAGADHRYMEYLHEMFPDREHVELPLQTTWRLTPPMCRFINETVLGTEWLIPGKNETPNDMPVKYVFDGWPSSHSFIFKEIMSLLGLVPGTPKKYDPEDIFILSASSVIKSSADSKHASPVITLANLLSEIGVHSFIRSDYTDSASMDCMKGKIVFSSFHTAKGRERPVCFVMGFDDSYFQYFNKDANPLECPNELYVALTRATERLYVIHMPGSKISGFLPFMHMKTFSNTCTHDSSNMGIKWNSTLKILKDKYKASKNKTEQTPNEKPEDRPRSVTDFIRMIPSDRINNIIKENKLIATEEILPANEELRLPVEVTRGKFTEYVADINGHASTLALEFIVNGEFSQKFRSVIDRLVNINNSSELKDVEKISFDEDNMDGKDFANNMLVAGMSIAWEMSNSTYRVRQLCGKYDWLHVKPLMTAQARMMDTIIEDQFEVPNTIKINMTGITLQDGTENTDVGDLTLNGRYDIISGNQIYEIKSVKTLDNTCILQAAIYDIMRQLCPIDYNYKILKRKLRDRLDDKESADHWSIGDAVCWDKGTKKGYIYELMKTKVKIIDATGETTNVFAKNVVLDTEHYENKIKRCKSLISGTFLFNVRNGHMMKVSVPDPHALIHALLTKNKILDDEAFKLRMHELVDGKNLDIPSLYDEEDDSYSEPPEL